MKIAIICPNFPPAKFEGGISHYSRLLAKNLILRGHKIVAITSTEYSYPNSKDPISGDLERIFIKGPWSNDSLKILNNIAVTKKIDVLLLQYSPASFKLSFRLRWAISRFACPKITVFHTLWGKKADRIIGIMNLFGSKKIIATNSEILTIMKKNFSFLLKKTHHIPIGSNILHTKKSTKGNEEKLISYFGMLYPGKGLELILDVSERLYLRNQQFCVKFIGGGMLNHEQYEKEFDLKIKTKNLGGKVERMGLISENEVSKLLNKSRFIFLPYEKGLSDRRGSFMAAVEHEKAILSSPPIVDIPFLKNGENVLWPNNPSVSEYVRLAEKLLNDDKLVRQLEIGAKELSSNFSWTKIAEAYESALLD